MGRLPDSLPLRERYQKRKDALAQHAASRELVANGPVAEGGPRPMVPPPRNVGKAKVVVSSPELEMDEMAVAPWITSRLGARGRIEAPNAMVAEMLKWAISKPDEWMKAVAVPLLKKAAGVGGEGEGSKADPGLEEAERLIRAWMQRRVKARGLPIDGANQQVAPGIISQRS